jgi:hypothetical protein
MITKLLKHRSIQVFLAVTLYLVFASSLPLEIHRGFYTISLLMKDLLLWILPVTVGFFIAHAIASFEKHAPLFILTLFLFEAVSNAASVWYSYGCGHVAASHLQTIAPYQLVDTFSPLWRLALAKPVWWSADKGSLAGIALGLLAAFKFPHLRVLMAKGKGMAEWVLTRIFSRLIPIFILGFIARMYKTKLLEQMSSQYADFVLWLFVILIAYILLLFLVGSDFSWKTFIRSVKNLLPAAGMAFSSGCSLSSMPWTILGSSKNLKNPDLAKAVIPATTNIQQIGDCIINTFLCFLIYLQFYGHPPSLAVWIPFSLVFVLARYATAAVIGGAIFIMLPIYEYYLSFTPEMIAIILAFNVILDPLVTCSNVVANGALCRIFEKAWMYILRRLAIGKKEVTGG